MTWEQLIDWSRNRGHCFLETSKESFICGSLIFNRKGSIWRDNLIIAYNRSYEQMKTIIQALFEED